MSRWSDCGIVVVTAEGLQVLEATKIVRLVPFEIFVSWAKDGKMYCLVFFWLIYMESGIEFASRGWFSIMLLPEIQR